MSKKIIVMAAAVVCMFAALAISGCGDKTAADDIKNFEIVTGDDGLTNLDMDGLRAVYDEDVIDLGMTMDECVEAMGGAPKKLTDPAYSENTYSYYTSDGEYNICMSFKVKDDGTLSIQSLSTNIPS